MKQNLLCGCPAIKSIPTPLPDKAGDEGVFRVPEQTEFQPGFLSAPAG